jgi:Fic family protein
MLISALFKNWGLLNHSIFDLSVYMLVHRNEYMNCLSSVSHNGEWDEWIAFFLKAVARQAEDALQRIAQLTVLRTDYQRHISKESRSITSDSLVDHLFVHLAITNKQVADLLGVTVTTAQKVVDRLVSHGLLEEATGRKRDRVYRAREIIAVLDGYE